MLYKHYVLFKNHKYLDYYYKRRHYYYKKLKEVYRGFNGAYFLDYGCGTGWLATTVAKEGAISVGIDSIREYCQFSKCRAHYEGVNAEFIVADGANLPLRKGAFDLIVSIDVLEHLKSPDKCFLEISRVLGRNSTFIFEAPNRLSTTFNYSHTNIYVRIARWWYRKKGTVIEWYRCGFFDFETLFTYGQLIKLLKGAGFNQFYLPPVERRGVIVKILKKLGILDWFRSAFFVVVRSIEPKEAHDLKEMDESLPRH